MTAKRHPGVKLAALAVVGTAALTGCGGSSSSNGSTTAAKRPAATPVPATAQAAAAAFAAAAPGGCSSIDAQDKDGGLPLEDPTLRALETEAVACYRDTVHIRAEFASFRTAADRAAVTARWKRGASNVYLGPAGTMWAAIIDPRTDVPYLQQAAGAPLVEVSAAP
jgi:hypothetical protein